MPSPHPTSSLLPLLLLLTLLASSVTAQLVPGAPSSPQPPQLGKPQVPPRLEEEWLDPDALFYALVEPGAGDDGGEYPADDCFANWCFPSGMFVDLVMSHCNSTLSNLQPQKLPKSPRELEQLLGDCICGNQKGQAKELFSTVASMWKTCATCLNGATGVRDPHHASVVAATAFNRACACEMPGPVQALMHMQDPGWTCEKLDQDKLRNGRRAGGANGRRPVPTSAPPPSAVASPSVAPVPLPNAVLTAPPAVPSASATPAAPAPAPAPNTPAPPPAAAPAPNAPLPPNTAPVVARPDGAAGIAGAAFIGDDQVFPPPPVDWTPPW
ncbi:hypothetical protein PhCBS80983_g01174 [Powellomyces hirtus]|uniref:Extracellular membrane protein CFEM domain-containing protein n=1 Tax=Powellomyces hirtus TaxID=109895 RepID=A0A507EDV4_9FUNG|nr:hypothetical protein PhCBS80983_g01174 [Powellomyces hirtus]